MTAVTLENVRELPLLAAAPSGNPEAGYYFLYRLSTDNREYIKFDDGSIAYYRPREVMFEFSNTGIDNRDWLSQTDNGIQQRRGGIISPFPKCRIREIIWSNRNNPSNGAVLNLIMYTRPITQTGFMSNSSPQKFNFDTDDSFVTSYANGKRFVADLTDQNIILDRTDVYAMEYINTEDVRDIYMTMTVEEIP